MPEKETGDVFHLPPLQEEILEEDLEYAWSRKWVILNTVATAIGSVTGLVALVVVSLLTRRVSKQQLDRFYACLRTPVGADEPEVEPFTLPPGVEPPPRKVWFDVFELEIPVISRVGLAGLVAAFAAVVVFIAGVYWIFSLGT